ncbi:unnamed protein product [Callosobruchus maculatus]|nr:unnamed protein product [Callosobruchus maculatus]
MPSNHGVSNSGVNNYSTGMMPPPRTNAFSYNMYHQQYVGPNRSYFVPAAAGSRTGFEHNSISHVGPRQIVGSSNNKSYVNMDQAVRPDMFSFGAVSNELPSTSMQGTTLAAARAANSSITTPRFSTNQSPTTAARSSLEMNNMQQPIRGQQNVKESPAMRNQQQAPNATPITNFDAKNTVNDVNKTTQTFTNFDFKIYGSTDRERIFMLTGTVERVIKWSKIFRNQFCYFEVIAPVISIQEGSVNTQKVMLLRNKKGPILQVIYYETTHIDIQDFYIGQMLTCTGRMTGANIFNALCIRSASQEEVDSLQRLTEISEQAVECHLSS